MAKRPAKKKRQSPSTTSTRASSDGTRRLADSETGKLSVGRSSGSKLEKVRRRLRKLDTELVGRLNARAELAKQLADLQADGGDSVQPLNVVELDDLAQSNPGPLDVRCVRAVFRELVSGCCQITRPMRVAYLGPQFSYSHLAAVECFGQSSELIPVTTIATVFEEVCHKHVDFGLVPLENSTDGRISDTLNMLTRVQVRISGELQLKVHHHLLARGERTGIRRVCSKPQAISQCRGWLSQNLPEAEVVEMTSTTAAAELAVAQADVAAIASRQAGVNYGLRTLAANIEDNQGNITRFAVIGHQSAARTGNDKTSLLFQVPHQPGALADAMAVFKRNRLNLTWIESFPLPGATSEYLFFAEFLGHERDAPVQRAIAGLEKMTDRLEVLGSYAQTTPV